MLAARRANGGGGWPTRQVGGRMASVCMSIAGSDALDHTALDHTALDALAEAGIEAIAGPSGGVSWPGCGSRDPSARRGVQQERPPAYQAVVALASSDATDSSAL